MMQHFGQISRCTFCAVLLLLAGCSQFTSEEKPPMEGERISVLQLQRDLDIDATGPDNDIVLQDSWTNQFWPQTGGYPNHVMGHVALGPKVKKVWEQSIGAGGGRRSALIAPPVVADGFIFTMDTKGVVSSFDVKSGKKKWRETSIPDDEKDSNVLGGGLAYAGGKLYVTNGYKYLAAFNPENGHVVWRQEISAPARSAPVVSDDRVYIITIDNQLMAFSSADGTPLWNYTGVAETTNLLGATTVAVDRSLVVLPMSSGELYGLRPENGQVVWEDNLSAVRKTGPLTSIADIRGLPVIDQGLVFAVSYSGRLVAIDQVSGRRLWQREIGSAETPWTVGAYVFVLTSSQQLVALSRETGAIHWVTQLDQYGDKDKEHPMVWTGPVLAGGRLILASSTGKGIEVNAVTGAVMGEMKFPGAVTIAPIVAAEHLFILTQNGKLAAYH